VTVVLTFVALFGAGEQEDRGNRWVLIAFGVPMILIAFLPAYTDRKDLFTFNGDAIRWLGVVLFTAGGALRLWPVFVLGPGSAAWSPSSLDICWLPLAFASSSVIPAIWECLSARWVGLLLFVPKPVCCWWRFLFLRWWGACAPRRNCCAHTLAAGMTRTGPARRG